MKTSFRNLITRLLEFEAKLVIRKYEPKIVAVVGSVGKTSAKDAIYEALSTKFFVRMSEKSYNSEFGIPLTVLGCANAWSNPFLWIRNLVEGFLLIVLKQKYPKWLVLEIGVDRPGDMKKVGSWLHPDIIVYTRLPDVPVHVEYFDSPEAVIEEKLSLIESLKDNGTLILNGDDPNVREILDRHTAIKSITFGCAPENNVSASYYRINQKNFLPSGIQFRVNKEGNSVPLHIHGALGKQHVYPALAALATGLSLNINFLEMTERLEQMQTAPGRMRIIEGIKGSIIIDDSYNSSPVAADEALETLKAIKNKGKKIVVLGDMLELGKYSTEAHKRIGNKAGEIADFLVTIGPRARHIAEGALAAGLREDYILQYDDAARAGKELEKNIESNDVILVKGSQGVRAEKTVEEIMAHPLGKHRLLCRQDKAWLSKS